MKSLLNKSFGIIAFLIAMILANSVSAQGRQPPTQEDLKKFKQKKLDAEFFENAKWFTDYDEALKESAKAKKFILAYFTRSYAG